VQVQRLPGAGPGLVLVCAYGCRVP
jgi:hypothetical protein